MDFTQNISEHFTLGEFFVTDAKNGGKAGLIQDFLALPIPEQNAIINNLKALAGQLERYVRDHYKRPVVISSGWRSRRVNSLVSKAKNSSHLTGKAADIIIVGTNMKEAEKYLDSKWSGGLGRGVSSGKGFIHLDIRPNKVRFSY